MGTIKWQVEIASQMITDYNCGRYEVLVPLTDAQGTMINSFDDWYALGVL